MAGRVKTDNRQERRSGGLFGSRIARLILASNLAGLAILIAGAMILNEMRAGLVVSKKQDLASQAQVFTSLLSEGATVGQPQPLLEIDKARDVIRSLNLSTVVRARVVTIDGEVAADSLFLSDRVDVSALPPLRDPSQRQLLSARVSNWFQSTFRNLMPSRGGNAVITQSYSDEFEAAMRGSEAASQRFSDRGQRVISVSVPISHVSAVVGVLTLEANDVEAIVRAERTALIPFIGVAMLVALITSVLLTLGIARPLRRLANAADRVRTGQAERLDLPNFIKRKDEIGQLTQAVDAMTDSLFERITANEQFAADVAHELKNPLTSIRSAVETAEMVKDDPVASEKLRKVIAKDVQRLDRLITDISNASRLEAEITRSAPADLDITRFVSDIVQTYENRGPADRRVKFIDETMGGGLRVRGRDGPLGQVVRNLVDNALSFSPEGGTVKVIIQQAANGAQTLARILVEDDGPGIPEDKLETIFDRFYTDRPKGSAFGNNSGLGLSIVHQIVTTHRGAVRAENREQGGARFVLDLPAE